MQQAVYGVLHVLLLHTEEQARCGTAFWSSFACFTPHIR